LVKKRVKQNYYNYTLRDGRFVVKYGITKSPDRRVIEMDNAGLKFTSMTINPVAVSKKTALKRENERIKAYKRSHKGRKPKYNK